MSTARNPFRYGGPVPGTHFCGREPELERLERALRRERPVLVSGPRRAGKSSLLAVAGERLAAPDRAVVRVDAWAMHRERSLTRGLGRVLSRAETALADCAPGDAGPGAVVLMDNAAAALELAGERFREALREGIESSDRIAWVFALDGTGGGTFSPGNGALFSRGAAEEITLGPIPFAAWLPFVLERFLESKRWIENEHVRAACDLTRGHPFHTQHLFHALWELCGEDESVDGTLVGAALDVVLDREGHAWSGVWRDLTSNQRAFLRAAALEDGELRPFGAAFLERSGLGSASSAQRAAEALRDDRLIEGSDGGYRIRDPTLRAWLRRDG